ncbi:hypothetical protein AAFF_G00148760 [Aldrovandia affinis]|uniref:Uncharacterized protein n=1 Tax=Aldrovandia affinis TaxID=143900 RepID=A0AAD7W8M5_9TELE|nr:hypothetical protein AAFF_G00148760 [Aldrovandia affinis]
MREKEWTYARQNDFPSGENRSQPPWSYAHGRLHAADNEVKSHFGTVLWSFLTLLTQNSGANPPRAPALTFWARALKLCRALATGVSPATAQVFTQDLLFRPAARIFCLGTDVHAKGCQTVPACSCIGSRLWAGRAVAVRVAPPVVAEERAGPRTL